MQSQFSNSPLWSSRTKRLVVVGMIGLTALAVWWFSQILPLVIVAIVLAYILTPLVNFIERRVMALRPLQRIQNRGLAVGFAFLLVILLFVVILLVVLPMFVGQLEEFGRSIPDLLRTLESEITRILSEPLTFNNEPILLEGKPLIPLERILEATGAQDINDLLHLENLDLVGAAQTFLGSLGSVTGPAFSFLGGAVNTLINVTFLIVMMFYLMKDGELFAKRIVDLAPPDYHDDARRLLHELARIWNAYLRGQLLISLTTGLVIFTAGIILGVPNALILGLFSGILQLIPNIGPLLAVIPAALIALLSESSTLPYLSGAGFMLVVIVVWVVIQNFILFVIIPRVMGESLDLHPFIVLLAVIAGASVAGALGIILAVPFVASARLLAIYVYGKLTDTDPFHRLRPERVSTEPTLLQRVAVQLNQRLAAQFRAGNVK
jgi:predicted PurR-regulated permease PerM